MNSRLPMPSASPCKGQKRPGPAFNDENKIPFKAARYAGVSAVNSPLEQMRANGAFRKSPSAAQRQAAKAKRRSIRTLNQRAGSGQSAGFVPGQAVISRTIGVTGSSRTGGAGGVRKAPGGPPPASRNNGGGGGQTSRRVLSDLCRPTLASRNRSSGQGQSLSRATSSSSQVGSERGARGSNASHSQVTSTSDLHNVQDGEAKKPVRKKRAAWDLKGRMADMEDLMRNQKSTNIDLRAQIEQLSMEKSELKETAEERRIRTQEASQQAEELLEKLRTKTNELDRLQSKYVTEQERYSCDIKALTRQRDIFEADLDAALIECKGLKATIATLTGAQAGMEAQLSAAKSSLAQSNDLVKQQQRENSEKEAELEKLKKLVAEQAERIRDDETVRRKLHNTIQELKGNIRVFCRIRPLLPNEVVVSRASTITSSSLSLPVVPEHIHFPDTDDKTVVFERTVDQSMNESSLNSTKLGGNNRLNKFDFTFDRVFRPTSKQTEVFDEISQLVQSALDGYNVCIFAYGQTGSGKTYTMEGPNPAAVTSDPDKAGMIPLAVQQVFKCIKDLEYNSWKYDLEASFVEIYNETLRDLLDPREDKKCDIKLVGKDSSEIFVSGLTTEAVTSVGQVQKLLKIANDSRAVAATKCNDRSSRSHSVFRLKITGANEATGESCEGMLNLVDLAGSERLKESESEGDRLRETQHINTSLSTLGLVIMSLAKKDQHIPYRNSKLTYLLQNSLGGNSKTLMFVNISPKEEHFGESINSLRFATKVNQCHIGTASKRVK